MKMIEEIIALPLLVAVVVVIVLPFAILYGAFYLLKMLGRRVFH